MVAEMAPAVNGVEEKRRQAVMAIVRQVFEEQGSMREDVVPLVYDRLKAAVFGPCQCGCPSLTVVDIDLANYLVQRVAQIGYLATKTEVNTEAKEAGNLRARDMKDAHVASMPVSMTAPTGTLPPRPVTPVVTPVTPPMPSSGFQAGPGRGPAATPQQAQQRQRSYLQDVYGHLNLLLEDGSSLFAASGRKLRREVEHRRNLARGPVTALYFLELVAKEVQDHQTVGDVFAGNLDLLAKLDQTAKNYGASAVNMIENRYIVDLPFAQP